MLKRLWKGMTEEKPVCASEMKIGVQIHPDIRCQLPAGHGGHHQANVYTRWPPNPEETGDLQKPGGPEEL